MIVAFRARTKRQGRIIRGRIITGLSPGSCRFLGSCRLALRRSSVAWIVPSWAPCCYNCPMKKKAAAWGLSIALLVLSLCLFGIYWPIGKKEMPPEGYSAFRDDALARRYCPVFESPSSFGPIVALYYRAARDGEGKIHIAYHPVWERESNSGAGMGPLFSRTVYTGGLSLQRAMFGKGDVESIGVTIDADGKVVVLEYETAKDYDPEAFSVKHLPVKEEGKIDLPLRFRVVSWNHLFAWDGNEASAMTSALMARPDAGRGLGTEDVFTAEGFGLPGTRSVPFGYFTEKLWSDYAMWKNPETILRKNRSHFLWERGLAR